MCPMNGTVLKLYQERKYDCPKFIQGDYVTKRARKAAVLNPQDEGLF